MNPEAVDGRTARREKSRQQIIDAMVELVTDGKHDPTAENVARIAGVTMRTVFRHFEDMDSLYREIIVDIETQTEALRVPFDPDRDWKPQFDELVLRRTGIFEKLMSQILWTQSSRYKSEVVDTDVQKYAKRMRQSLRRTLPGHFVADVEAFSAVEAMLSSEIWIRLRRDQRLSVKRATGVIQKATAAILKDSGL